MPIAILPRPRRPQGLKETIAMFDFDREKHEADRARCAAWRARHETAIGSGPAPAAAETIADDLPMDAQRALLEGCPWAMEIEGPAALQLEFFELLEKDGGALSDLGVSVLRTLLRRDSDWARRDEEFGKWFGEFYAAAYKVAAPGHEVAHLALFLHPDAHDPLIEIVSARREGVVISREEDVQVAEYLRSRGAVIVSPFGRGRRIAYRIDATELGRQVAILYNLVSLKRAEIFEGAKQSAPSAESDRLVARATKFMTAKLGAILRSADRANDGAG